MPLANLANVLGGGNDESSGVTAGSFSSVTSTGGTFSGANGQTIVGNASGGWAITANGTSQSITNVTTGTGMFVIGTIGVTTRQNITRITGGNTTGDYAPVLSLFRTSVSEGFISMGGATGTMLIGNTAGLADYADATLTSSAGIVITTTNGAVRIPGTTSSTTSITGAFRVGNDTAATTVGIGAGNITIGNILGVPGAAVPVLTTTTTVTSGGAAQVGTLTNAPAAGNPTKWVPINDAGVTRYFPCW